jgi:hypothetical protein
MVTGTKEIYLLFPPMNMQNSICFLTLWLQRQSLIRTLTSHTLQKIHVLYHHMVNILVCELKY